MSWITDLGYAAAFIGGGVLIGWLLFQFYVYRERLDIRQHIPEQFQYWSFYNGVASGLAMLVTFPRSLKVSGAFGLLSVFFLIAWQGDKQVSELTEASDG